MRHFVVIFNYCVALLPYSLRCEVAGLRNQDLSTSLTKHEQLFGPSYLIHTRHTLNEDGLKRLAIYSSPDLNCSRGPFWTTIHVAEILRCCKAKQPSIEAVGDVDVKVIIIKLFVCKWNGWKNGVRQLPPGLTSLMQLGWAMRKFSTDTAFLPLSVLKAHQCFQINFAWW